MESRLSTILHIMWEDRGHHHPSTIDFWRTVQMELEKGKNNRIISHVSPDEYVQIRKLAYVGSNRTPTNELAICYGENAVGGSDV